MELAGVEPASKQGTLVLSTRLSWPSFSSGGKTQATNRRLICYIFGTISQPMLPILWIPAPLYPFSPQTRLGVTSRSGALHPNTLIYYTSIKQREHKFFRQLYFEARLTSIASLLGVLTQPFYLLSKPNSPVASAKKCAKLLLFYELCKKKRKKMQKYLCIWEKSSTFARFFGWKGINAAKLWSKGCCFSRDRLTNQKERKCI